MGHRLSKIYTRTGDDGMTGLGDGSRVDKDSPRVEAFGELDELNSVLGLLASYPIAEELLHEIADVQHDLFDIGGELCIPGRQSITERQVERLEHCLDTLNSSLQPLKEFVLPGGSRPAAVCHLARAVCRRAERRLVTLGRQTEVNAATLCYLNRLSDLLFVMARSLNRGAGVGDVLWQQRKNA